MSAANIGKIQYVDLRDVWPHEALDFTQWLARQENLDQLAGALGIELKDAETEYSVGSFSLDIFAKDADDNTVIIENQLEDTNHDHLGKLMTYAAGTDATLAVWVVKRAREEHQKAIEWLNNHTDMRIGFALVEVAAVKIGDSMPAPLFSAVETPNDWAKSVKASEDMGEGQRLRLAYWQTFCDAAKENKAFSARFNTRKPNTMLHSSLSCGDSRYHIDLGIATEDKNVSANIYVPRDKELGKALAEHVAEFEGVMDGIKAVIINAEVASGLRFYHTKCDIAASREHWLEYMTWQMDSALKLREKFEELQL